MALQKTIFEEVAKDINLASQFYFTGGTALSAFYLNHRESEDLDFFSEIAFKGKQIHEFIDKLSSILNIPYRFTEYEKINIYEFVKEDKFLIKLDFVHHPYPRLEKEESYKGFEIDSLIDIAANKLLTINQRTDVKDFVDLYFLLKDFTIWDLIYGVKEKYRRETDIILLAMDMTKVEDFDFLPRMITPLTLNELKVFFREKAKEVGKRAVE